MLSPHEVSTLMLLQNAQDFAGLDPANLETLVEHQLVHLEQLASGNLRARLTGDGESLLQVIAGRH